MRLTEKGRKKAEFFIAECRSKRKEILDARLDTGKRTSIPEVEDIEWDLNFTGVNNEGEYCGSWSITDTNSSVIPIRLSLYEDFKPAPGESIHYMAQRMYA